MRFASMDRSPLSTRLGSSAHVPSLRKSGKCQRPMAVHSPALPGLSAPQCVRELPGASVQTLAALPGSCSRAGSRLSPPVSSGRYSGRHAADNASSLVQRASGRNGHRDRSPRREVDPAWQSGLPSPPAPSRAVRRFPRNPDQRACLPPPVFKPYNGYVRARARQSRFRAKPPFPAAVALTVPKQRITVFRTQSNRFTWKYQNCRSQSVAPSNT